MATVENRPDMRANMKEETPAERAQRRAEEIRSHIGTMDDGTDRFYIAPEMVPDGWSYEWKRHTVLGAEDPAHAIALARKGWEPVPVKRHPELMPAGYEGNTILRDGMMLMERPLSITEEARAIERKNARELVRGKEAQLSQAPNGQFERNNKDSSLVKVKRAYEPMPVPEN